MHDVGWGSCLGIRGRGFPLAGRIAGGICVLNGFDKDKLIGGEAAKLLGQIQLKAAREGAGGAMRV